MFQPWSHALRIAFGPSVYLLKSSTLQMRLRCGISISVSTEQCWDGDGDSNIAMLGIRGDAWINVPANPHVPARRLVDLFGGESLLLALPGEIGASGSVT